MIKWSYTYLHFMTLFSIILIIEIRYRHINNDHYCKLFLDFLYFAQFSNTCNVLVQCTNNRIFQTNIVFLRPRLFTLALTLQQPQPYTTLRRPATPCSQSKKIKKIYKTTTKSTKTTTQSKTRRVCHCQTTLTSCGTDCLAATFLNYARSQDKTQTTIGVNFSGEYGASQNKVFFEGAPPVNGERITQRKLFNPQSLVVTFKKIQ